jgi:hypothetical protein
MRRSFWKAASISVAAYAAAVLLGFLVDFRVTGFAVPALFLSWTLFCVVRAIQLRAGGAHHVEALPCDRESYGFAVGGSVASFAALAAVVVLTQVV